MCRILIGVALLLSPLFALTQDVSADVCRLNDGYQFSFTGDVDSWSFEGAETYDLQALIATGYGVKFTIYYDGGSYSIYGYPEAPRCADDPTIWHPGAPSIPVMLTSDCAWVEIDNHDGGWSRVQSDGKDVLLHYGESLIGSSGQSTDPVDYRAIETGCFT